MHKKSERLLSTLPPVKNIERTISIPSTAIVEECRAAINNCQLGGLIAKAKINGNNFINLNESEKERLYIGLIRVGEALTFCRDF